MDNQRLIVFAVLTLSIFFGWQKWIEHRYPDLINAGNASSPTTSAPPDQVNTSPGVVENVQRGQRILVKTDLFQAEIDTIGADLRQVTLVKYGETGNPKKPFVLLQDSGEYFYIAQSGLIGHAGIPNHKSLFSTNQTVYQLEKGQDQVDVRLETTGAHGIKLVKTYVFRKGSYLIDVKQEVDNATLNPIKISAYYRLLRDSKKPAGEVTGFMVGTSSFTGPAVYTSEGKFQKVDFADLDNKEAEYVKTSKDGWVAMIQHYFVSAWITSPTGQLPICGASLCHYDLKTVGQQLYSAGVIVDLPVINPGEKLNTHMPLYVGPEETRITERIAPGFDLVKDYGHLTILAVPLFAILDFIHSHIVANWGWAIILLTILVKAIFFPLATASYRSMAKMKQLAPRMQEMKARYGEDKVQFQKAMMDMYKTEKVNPLGGCLPILIQIPVFMALYWTLLAAVELRQAPWLGWIVDLSQRDPYFILPILMTITMYLQTLLSPPPPDPVQAKVMKIMPLVFSALFFMFPAGLVLYYVVNNILSILQQWFITRQFEEKNKTIY